MNKTYSALFGACIFLASLSAYSQTSDVAVKTIPSMDVPRYLGAWYENAKYLNWF
jgi:apolipoprotein D and lipocalin family protein